MLVIPIGTRVRQDPRAQFTPLHIMQKLFATTLATGLLAAASYAEEAAKPVDCAPIIERIQATAERSKADPIELLRLVDTEVSAQPACACEIVKAAILGTDCDDAIVGYVVETAVRAAPEHMRLIAQCAIATAPDSLNRVQEVMARLSPSAGKEVASAKSAKGKNVEVEPAETPPDPLDIPYVIIPPFPPVVVTNFGTETDFRQPEEEEE